MLYKLLACNWDKNQSVMGFNCCSLYILYFRCIDAVYLYLEIIYPDGFNTKRGITLKGLFLGTYSLPGPDVSLHFFLSNYELRDGNSQNNKDDKNRVTMAIIKFLILSQIRTAKFVCIRVCIAVGSFYIMVILAEPSIGGQTGADELLKTSSLYIIILHL